MKRLYNLLPIALVLSLVFYFTYEALASSTGRVMRTSTVDGGCGGSGCHGTSTSSSTSLSLVSGELMVEPGSTNSYTIRLSNSQQPKAGINIAVKTSITGATNIGTLNAPTGSGLQVLVDELTHTSPKTISSGTVDFPFTWQAPDKAGVYYLRAVGNAVNESTTPEGDQWNFMEPLQLIVRGIELTEPLAGGGYCTGSPLIIKWESAGIPNIKIELSTDGGSSWGVTLQENFIATGGNWTWNIPSDFQQGDNFRIRVSDVTNPSRKSEMTESFGIYGQFSITKHPESKNLCPGDNLELYVNTQGTGIKYQWRKNGAIIPGATDSTYTISNANASTPGYYGVIISSSCFSPIISNEANIQVFDATTIKTQPQSQYVCLGNTAIFQIDASGQSVKYQWIKGNKEIVGETNATLTIQNVDKDDVATYYCEVSGSCGIVNSDKVTLDLNSSPQITLQPLNQTVCEKKSVTFVIDASGAENKYDWYFNDSKISTVSNKEFKIESVTSANAGTYHCVVSNQCGEPVISQKVQLTVNPVPLINSQPQARTVMVGDKVDFSITAQNALTYQWRLDSKNIQGANSESYNIESAEIKDGGNYDCIVTNDCGTINSNVVKLIVNEPTPGPRVLFSSLIVNFGNVFEEKSLDSLISNFITNNGNDTLLIDSIRITSNDTTEYFEIEFKDSTELIPGEAVDLKIKFTPLTPGQKTAKLMVYSNAVDLVPFVDLIGYGAFWDIASNTDKIDYGKIKVESDSITFRIYNQSDYDISFIDVKFSGDGECESSFRINKPELPSVVTSKMYKDIQLMFEPVVYGKYICSMDLTFFGTDKVLTIPVEGFYDNGLSVDSDEIIPEFTVSPNPSTNNLNFEYRITNHGRYKLQIFNNEGKIVRNFSSVSIGDTDNFSWDCRDDSGNYLPSGSYTAILEIGGIYKKLNLLIVK
jgi:hypothetical protein